MDSREAFTRMSRSIRRRHELQELGAPDSRTLVVEGLTAVIAPAAPERSVVNAVAVEDFATLAPALDELAATYAEAGVRAWMVWVPDRELAARGLLSAAGHVCDAAPAAMLLSLEELIAPDVPEPDWSGDWDLLAAACDVNDAAWGDPAGGSAHVLAGMPRGSGHLYVARADGQPAAFVLVQDHEGDCDFWLASTRPEARGQGFVTWMLHRAMSDARDRGCTTSTTQASAMGEPIYARLGFRAFGRMEMWERRAGATGAA